MTIQNMIMVHPHDTNLFFIPCGFRYRLLFQYSNGTKSFPHICGNTTCPSRALKLMAERNQQSICKYKSYLERNHPFLSDVVVVVVDVVVVVKFIKWQQHAELQSTEKESSYQVYPYSILSCRCRCCTRDYWILLQSWILN